MSPIPVVIVEPDLPGCVALPVLIIGLLFACAMMDGFSLSSNQNGVSSYVAQTSARAEQERKTATKNQARKVAVDEYEGKAWLEAGRDVNTPRINKLIIEDTGEEIVLSEKEAIALAKEIMYIYDKGGWACITTAKKLELKEGEYKILFKRVHPQDKKERLDRSVINLKKKMYFEELCQYISEAL